jgi:hypothetical protein
MENNTRLKKICEIHSVEILAPTEEGVELNEGYQYEVNGSLPQLADSIAKMAVEFDNNNDMLGESAGSVFISLIVEYYNRSKGGAEQ